ncbi:TPA: hypothetical protein MW252_002273 [Acinetobacter nosocomialis]|nr:hypothetical protein [Acinetobacter nosocomialis]
MSRGEYNEYQGWQIPENENPNDPGYLIEYKDGGKANHPNHEGYISWSPKDIFEHSYQLDGFQNCVMGREIHKDDNEVTVFHNETVKTRDGEQSLEPGHFYDVAAGDTFTPIQFQLGPVKEVGVNGITNEALLAIVLHRLRVLNEKFPCRENSLAITNIEQGQMWLEQRTRNRQKRGVEGYNIA